MSSGRMGAYVPNLTAAGKRRGLLWGLETLALLGSAQESVKNEIGRERCPSSPGSHQQVWADSIKEGAE